ncbi:RecQ mediated genome instability protein Rmi1 [Amniculicola lignicola CBS 123094]|uniref:RecQ-mediated genome instability protein 1 n=1 Tax=Amniculicola lignicola CBS 123094 TaxID=1392246 RepID=A0A6A5WHW5_9PLEO|nr:RecQ mediated genome instability protein Rmi1 [Amniculicola lignicola CBS 123094]
MSTLIERPADSSMANHITAELTQHLNSRHLYPSQQWLQTFLSGVRPNNPLPATKQTAVFRLLATDITSSLTQPPSGVFPVDVLQARIQTRTVLGPILCQVLDVEDVGHSRWSQVESIESQERGETTKGREVVRVLPGENEGNGGEAPVPPSKGPFKLLLQDAKGAKVYAFDLRGIENINAGMSMGVKLLLRNFEVRRGVIMLEPTGVQILGGKIEELDKMWKEGRKERLIAAANAGGDD